MKSVGAGGGSIAEVSELTKSLRVGPRSAGAMPGPVAYRRGGTEPTVSDANVVLGYLPSKLLGGDMELDVEGARKAVANVGESLGLSPEDAAQGILDIANEVMLGALRLITVQRGLDPRDFGMVAFGGAGPLHANALAELLECYPVVVPANPGVLSALGFLESEFKNEFVKTLIRSASDEDESKIWDSFAELKEKAQAWLIEQDVAEADRGINYALDLRYEQQGFEVSIPVSAASVESRSGMAQVHKDFHETHERLNGVRFDLPIELVTLRAVATGGTSPVEESPPKGGTADVNSAVMDTQKGTLTVMVRHTAHRSRPFGRRCAR